MQASKSIENHLLCTVGINQEEVNIITDVEQYNTAIQYKLTSIRCLIRKQYKNLYLFEDETSTD